MYKEELENIEICFLYKKRGKELIKTKYNPKTNIHYWYFNTKLCYLSWKDDFKDLNLKPLAKNLITIAASNYILYKLENKDYKNSQEKDILYNDILKIEPEITKIMKENEIILKM